MNRFGLLLLGALAAGADLRSTASAQATGTTTPTVTTAFTSPLVVRRSLDGTNPVKYEQLTNESIVYGTLTDCDKDREFTFTVDSYAAPAPVIEAWLGVGSSDCSTAANRTRSTSTVSRPVCKLLDTVTATSKPVLRAKAKDIFSQNWPPLDGSPYDCDQVKDQKYVVYVIPLAQKTNLEGSSATEPTPIGAIGVLRATFTVFTEPPTAPSGVTAETGEREIGVNFNPIAGTVAKTRYRAYYDYGTGAEEADAGVDDAGVDEDAAVDLDAGAELDASAEDAAVTMDASGDLDASGDAAALADAAAADAAAAFTKCGSGLLRAGARPPTGNQPFLYVSKALNSGESKMGDLDKKGIPIKGLVAVSVVTIDPAGNESALTEPICVERVDTLPFLEACEMDPKCKGGFDECSVSAPGSRTGSPFGLSLLFGLGVALLVRRSKRAVPRASKFRRHV